MTPLRNSLRNGKGQNRAPFAERLTVLNLFLGQISTQRAALRAREFRAKYSESVSGFLEEMIIRRELSDNFCYYNLEKYDSLKGGYAWAQKTLADHSSDQREKVYTKEQLENAKSHDLLWNAAQVSQTKLNNL